MTLTDQPPTQLMPVKIDRGFVEEHVPWMLSLANKILTDPQLAEDAVQDALLAVHTTADNFEGRSSVRTWLYRITLNAALTIQRKSDKAPQELDELLPEFAADACRIEAPWQHLRSTEDVLEHAELVDFVRHSVAQLPEDYRICLQLRDFEELPVADVADILKISADNVKVRTHRARSALKRLLEPLLRGKSSSEITESPLPPEFAAKTGRSLKRLMLKYLPMMITCQQFEAFIIEYLEDSLPTRQRRVFEFHIRTCRECREYLAAYQRTRDIAQASIATLDTAPTDLVTAVLSAIGQQP